MVKSDRDEIVELMVRYGASIDTRDFALLRTCFTPDAVVSYASFAGEELRGADALDAFLRRSAGTLDATHHMFLNFTVDADGDTGRFTCAVQAQHIVYNTPEGDIFTVGGNYANDVVRTPEGWRMTRLDFKPIWTAGNPALVEHEPVHSAA